MDRFLFLLLIDRLQRVLLREGLPTVSVKSLGKQIARVPRHAVSHQSTGRKYRQSLSPPDQVKPLRPAFPFAQNDVSENEIERPYVDPVEGFRHADARRTS